MGASPAETSFFADVDNANRSDRLLAAMDATGSWAAVQELRAWTAPAITEGQSLLDVGCGQGDVAIGLAATNTSLAVTGIDSSSEMIDAARTRASARGVDVTLRQGDATRLPFDDHAFDAVRCERVLQWLDEPERAVAELVRVTAPGGAVALLDTDWRTFTTTVVDQDLEARMAGPWATPHAGAFLRSYLRRAGLSAVAAQAVVHHANHITGDASDGMFPFDQYMELQLARGLPRPDVERYLTELRRQSENGDLTLAVTMWAVIAFVPEQHTNPALSPR